MSEQYSFQYNKKKRMDNKLFQKQYMDIKPLSEKEKELLEPVTINLKGVDYVTTGVRAPYTKVSSDIEYTKWNADDVPKVDIKKIVSTLDVQNINNNQTSIISNKMETDNEVEEKIVAPKKFENLSVENIVDSFDVVSRMCRSAKFVIENGVQLKIDTSMLPGLTRSSDRFTTLDFLQHMYEQMDSHIIRLRTDIKAGSNVENNVNTVRRLISGLCAFLSRFDMISEQYKAYSDIFSRFKGIQEVFHIYNNNFFSQVLVGDSNKN